MQQATRKSLILGGNGALGKAMINAFKTGGWRTVSMDIAKSESACSSIVVDPKLAMKLQAESLME